MPTTTAPSNPPSDPDSPATPSPTERDNRMVWDGRPGHYEVWYLTVSDRASGTGFWIRYTVEAPRPGDGEPYVQLWFSRFDQRDGTFGVNQRFPVATLNAVAEPFSVRIGDAELRHDGMRGGVRGAGHDITWDLRWRPGRATHHHLPSLFYKIPVDTRVLSPSPAVTVDGTITVDGRRYDLAAAPGGQSHVWGKKHAYAWAWGHCNAFEGEDPTRTFFESISARLKRGQIIIPTLTVFTLHMDGEEIAFRDPFTLPLARSDFQTGSYHLVGANADTRLEAQFSAGPDATLLAEYLDPDGDPAFNHICCVADLTITVRKRSPFVGRWRDHRTLLSRGAAHFEWGGRAGDIVKVKRTLTAIP